MESIEITVNGQRYVLKGDETSEHLKEVASIVLGKVQSLMKERSNLSLQKASILTAFDLASLLLKSNTKFQTQRTLILEKAQSLLSKVEKEIQATKTH